MVAVAVVVYTVVPLPLHLLMVVQEVMVLVVTVLEIVPEKENAVVWRTTVLLQDGNPVLLVHIDFEVLEVVGVFMDVFSVDGVVGVVGSGEAGY